MSSFGRIPYDGGQFVYLSKILEAHITPADRITAYAHLLDP